VEVVWTLVEDMDGGFSVGITEVVNSDVEDIVAEVEPQAEVPKP